MTSTTFSRLFEPLAMARGPAMKNRFALAPMTNQQSFPDGVMSDDEYRWLTLRARGGFGLVLTAAAHVQATGQGFPGQIGAFGDQHIEGLARLASGLKASGAVAALQLHHGGNRSVADLVSELVCPSDDPATGARALTTGEVETLRNDFIAAAKRADLAGFDGIEIHGAHGYIITQFLSPVINRRTDRYGGNVENRARIVMEIIDGIRASCRADFQIGLRLSGERFGLRLGEIVSLTAEILRQEKIDYFELSAWDVAKEPSEPGFEGRTLLSCFTELPRGNVRLGAAGKIMSGSVAADVIEKGCDFVVIGRAAILRHDFPEQVRRDPDFASPPLPVSVEALQLEGVGPAFIDYLRSFPGFVGEPVAGLDHYAAIGEWLKTEG
ncbi:NADH:flavin oxidoreductase [Rhizorhabdus dicambivorans]|uniref:NADH:flavin oxidoreductase n=1 Tax=Rhizorhabdus dicambivorans TaxID=1850238 RepID=A0A2A4FSF1_9SPHN|nr:NADH:flavin oxidoreductase [Rhizorhabdus dicambivorans]ATE64715.1 NADH:flavin oxidoreductase [Rhizorhabdus dicambivorans]PCE41343.1 NADH:flavin oxidoreductase [Rhizorhabdus dicambivorans]